MEKLKIIIVFLSLLCVFFITESLNSQSIDFHVDSLEAGPAEGPWMFDFDDPGVWWQHDSNPFTFDINPPSESIHSWAYKNFSWSINDPSTTSFCTNEDLNVLNSTDDVILKLDNFKLAGFHHINTVNSNNAWNISGEAGDERTYVDGIGEIYVNDELKFRATNCILTTQVPYPTAVQMQNDYGIAPWQNDVGTGLGVISSGTGTIDIANSDANWVAELDPFNTGFIDYSFGTFDEVVQDNYGYYNFDISVIPSQLDQDFFMVEVPINDMQLDLEAEIDCFLNFISAESGGENDSLRTLFIRQFFAQPTRDLPSGINSISHLYWDITTTLASFVVDLTFDLENISNLSDINQLRILKRNNANSDWTVWDNYTLIDASHIRANNVDSFSQWAIGSSEDGVLPIVLSSFTSCYINDKAYLGWTTQSETNNQGWNIYKASEENLTAATKINEFPLDGAGTTSNLTTYSFEDNSTLIANNQYWYWLESIDYTGNTHFYSPITLLIPENNEEPASPEILPEYGLHPNYPNPFNPSTEISFILAETSFVEIIIYNSKGQIIRNLFKDSVEQDTKTSIIWDGKDNEGNKVSSGLYFYRLKTGDFSSVRKMVLLK
mgnify:FL=1